MWRTLFLALIFVIPVSMVGLPTQAEAPLVEVTLKGPDVAYNGLRLPFTGRVMAGGEPLPNVGVQLMSGTGTHGWAETDAAGRFAIPVYFAHTLQNWTFQVVVHPDRTVPVLVRPVSSEPVNVEVRSLVDPVDPDDGFHARLHSYSAFRYQGVVQAYAHVVGRVDPASSFPREAEGRVKTVTQDYCWQGAGGCFIGFHEQKRWFSTIVWRDGSFQASVGPFWWYYDSEVDQCYDALDTHLLAFVEVGSETLTEIGQDAPQVCLEWPE